MPKRIVSLLLALMLLGAVSMTGYAHEVPDYNQRGSISITMEYRDEPVSGGTLTLYRVADVDFDGGNYFFTYTEDFAECSVPVTELSSSGISTALAEIAKDKKLTGVTQTLDENGKTTFIDLEIGLYLLIQEEATSGFKKVNPFLVSVPYYEDGHYIYDVDTAPKNLPGPETEPSTEPTTEPTNPGNKLPQTGQTNWPVPVMAAVGMLLITAGFCLKTSAKKKTYEE